MFAILKFETKSLFWSAGIIPGFLEGRFGVPRHGKFWNGHIFHGGKFLVNLVGGVDVLTLILLHIELLTSSP